MRTARIDSSFHTRRERRAEQGTTSRGSQLEKGRGDLTQVRKLILTVLRMEMRQSSR